MPYFGVPIRNGIPIGLGSIAGFGASSQFSPASLFASGEQGAWYDPSDYSTLFQDAAGTTPVTGVEQAVGLMLDKSKGLVLGSELVSNTGGPFTSTTGWTANGAQTTVSLDSGRLRVDQTGTGTWGVVSTPLSGLTIGAWYKVVVSVTFGAGTMYVAVRNQAGDGAGVALLTLGSTSGTYTLYFAATQTTHWLQFQVANTSGNYLFANSATVKLLPGNHATQSTSTSRPILRARYNLLTYSEQFDNAFWKAFSASTVNANATTAPDGTMTADSVAANSATVGNGAFENTVSFVAGSTISFYAKANTVNWIAFGTANPSPYAWFDITNGTSGAVGNTAGCTASIQSVGNGWFRCTVLVSVANTRILLSPKPSGGAADPWSTVVNAIGDSVYLWGAQLLTAADQTATGGAYQRIAAATDYATISTTTGYAFLPYLAFDGSDDSMSTGSIDFTATDKMTVWSGVTKLSDATPGTLLELGPSPATTAGSFALNPGDFSTKTGAYWIHGARGTAAINANQFATTPANFAAPITNVLTGTSDIAGDLSVIRVNGVQQATATGDKGAGNFANASLYVGLRNNAIEPYNGRIYSLIARGAQSTAAQISATESWVAQKTGVTIVLPTSFVVLDSSGTSYFTNSPVADSSGNPYIVPRAVLASNGTSYNAI